MLSFNADDPIMLNGYLGSFALTLIGKTIVGIEYAGRSNEFGR